MSKSVCVIGDSITGGVVYLSDGGRYIHCPEAFMNLLGDKLELDVRNHSKFGCTAGAAFAKMDRFADDISNCDCALVMLGGNDSDFDWPEVASSPEAFHDCKTPLGDFRRYYGSILDKIMKLGVRPIVMNLLPVDGRRYFSWISKRSDPDALMRFLRRTESIEHWNEMYSIEVTKIAADRGVRLIDVRSAFLRSRFFDGLFSEDGIHPSPEGHRRIYEFILPQAEKIFA